MLASDDESDSESLESESLDELSFFFFFLFTTFFCFFAFLDLDLDLLFLSSSLSESSLSSFFTLFPVFLFFSASLSESSSLASRPLFFFFFFPVSLSESSLSFFAFFFSLFSFSLSSESLSLSSFFFLFLADSRLVNRLIVSSESLFSFSKLSLTWFSTLFLSSSSSFETLDDFFLNDGLSEGLSSVGASAAFLFWDGLLDLPDSVLVLSVFSACNRSFSTSSIDSSSPDSFLFFFFSTSSFDSLLLFFTSATFFLSSSTSLFTCILSCFTKSDTSDSFTSFFSTSALRLRSKVGAAGSTLTGF